MNRLFVLTDATHFPSHSDDAGLEKALCDRGFQVQPVVWDAWDPPPKAQVLVRTPWDYALKSELFLKLLKTIDDRDGTLFNDYKTLIWNLDKSYLLDLEAKGLPVVPSRVERRLQFSEEFLNSLSFPCVLKPLVGCAGRDTFLVLDKSQVLQKASSLEFQDVIIQPFIPEISSEGEYSFIYFGGKYSHAVLKTATPGEFRVQDDHGGHVAPYKPSKDEIQLGLEILARIGTPWTYGRVDLVRHNGQLLVMELELIEPELFFRFSEKGPELLSEALLS